MKVPEFREESEVVALSTKNPAEAAAKADTTKSTAAGAAGAATAGEADTAGAVTAGEAAAADITESTAVAADSTGTAADDAAAEKSAEQATKETVTAKEAAERLADEPMTGEQATAKEAAEELADEPITGEPVTAEETAGETEEESAEETAGETEEESAEETAKETAEATAEDTTVTPISEEEVIAQTVLPTDESDFTAEELYNVYVNNAFAQELPAGSGGAYGPGITNRKALSKAGSKLTGYNRQFYDLIAAELPRIAAGERAETTFELMLIEESELPDAWTAEELDTEKLPVESIVTIDEETGEVKTNENAKKAVVAKITKYLQDEKQSSIELDRIVHALTADNPYEMYWYNKTVITPLIYGIKRVQVKMTDGSTIYKLGFTGKCTIKFPVSNDYADYSDDKNIDQSTGASYLVDTSIGQSVQSAVANAQSIVAAHQSEDDYQKLCSFRDEICALTSYNFDAALGISNSGNYGNANQMVWVFDEDPGTNVVCEGYAKAFKYLCDAADFDGAVDCITATGYLDYDTPHMWNLVQMGDGGNYLVDVTNCDTGMMGAEGRLFLIGAAADDKIAEDDRETGYTVWPDGNEAVYTYDSNTLSTYDASQTTLSTRSYALNDDMLMDVEDAVYTGKAISPITLVDCGRTLVEGRDYVVTYKNSNTAAGTVKNIDVGTVTATITGIGDSSGSATSGSASGSSGGSTGGSSDGGTGTSGGSSGVSGTGGSGGGSGTGSSSSGGSGTSGSSCGYRGSLTTTFAITAKKVTPTVTLSTTKYVYSGKVRKPIATVKVGGTKLAASCYTVSYAKGRKNVGKYAVKVTLKGNYSGTKTIYFRIVPKGTKITSLKSSGTKITVKWKKQNVQTGGFQIQFSTSKTFGSGVKTKTIKGASKVSKSYSGFKKGKKYYVRIRSYRTVSGSKYYSAWSAVKTVKVAK